MSELLPPPSLENNFYGRLSDGMLHMMNFEATILGLKRPLDKAVFSEESAFSFAREVEEHSDLFDALFTDRRFHPAAAHSNLAPLVKVALLSAPYLVMQTVHNTADDKVFRREFSEYNASLRDAIRANPNMSRRALTAIIRGGVSWYSLPESYNYRSRAVFNTAITGASGEFTAEQLLNWGQENGQFTYTRSSTANDLEGIDFIINHPLARDPLLIDVKSSPERIQNYGLIDSAKPLFDIVMNEWDISYKTKLYVGANDALGKDQLRLNEADIEQKGIILGETIQEIATKINHMDSRELPGLLAELALKFNSV